MPRGLSLYDQALLQGRLWTPAELRPAIWLDSLDVSSLSFGAGVSEWRDKLGSGRNFTQATGTRQPGYDAVGFNGRPVLTFDGANSLLSGGANTAMSNYAATNSWAVFYAGYATSTFRSANVYEGNAFWGDSGAYFSGGVMNSPDALFTFSYDGTVDWVEQPYTFNARSVIENSGDGTNLYARLNGAVAATVASGATLTQGALLHVGGQWGAAGSPRLLNGGISEMLIMRNFLRSRENALVTGYLAWRWGVQLAADHPFANCPPMIGD